MSGLGTQVFGAEMNGGWRPGIPGGIPKIGDVVDVMGSGAVGDGVADDTDAFLRAIAVAASRGGAVWIPGGRYRITEPLRFGAGVVLRGDGAEHTSLEFDLNGRPDNAIEILAYGRGAWQKVHGQPVKGDRLLRAVDGSDFRVGEYVELQQANNAEVMYSNASWQTPWAEHSVGQLMQVKAVDGDSITVDPPLYFTPDLRCSPMIRSQRLVKRSGLEDLRLFRADNGDGHMVLLKNAAEVWLANVYSEMATKSHVATDTALRCEMRSCRFAHAHRLDGGGHGYGVNFSRHTTASLVEDCTFAGLRHAMLVQVGAIGNVFGYNTVERSDAAGSEQLPDISLHGHYPAANLFEANKVHNVGIGDYWGPAGPGNTFLRNHISGDVRIDDHSHGQILIANAMANAGTIKIDGSVQDSYVHAQPGAAEKTEDVGPRLLARRSVPESLYKRDR